MTIGSGREKVWISIARNISNICWFVVYEMPDSNAMIKNSIRWWFFVLPKTKCQKSEIQWIYCRKCDLKNKCMKYETVKIRYIFDTLRREFPVFITKY